MLEQWLAGILEAYGNLILPFGTEEAQVWGKLRVPYHEHSLDKQLAATALLYDLTVVTRNTKDFINTGVSVINPFS